MAIFHCDVKAISRKTGNICAAAAYRVGIKIKSDDDKSIKHAHRNSKDIECTEIHNWKGTVQTLCNAIENAEKRCDAKLAHEIMVALPRELDETQRSELVRDYTNQLVEKYGFAAISSIHKPGYIRDSNGQRTNDSNDNYHAHILATTRIVDEDGSFGAKIRQLDSPRTSRDEIKFIRNLWAETVNKHLENVGIDQRISSSHTEDELKNVHHGHKSELRQKNEELNSIKAIRNKVADELSEKIINKAKEGSYERRENISEEIKAANDRRDGETIGASQIHREAGGLGEFYNAIEKSFDDIRQHRGKGYRDSITGQWITTVPLERNDHSIKGIVGFIKFVAGLDERQRSENIEVGSGTIANEDDSKKLKSISQNIKATEYFKSFNDISLSNKSTKNKVKDRNHAKGVDIDSSTIINATDTLDDILRDYDFKWKKVYVIKNKDILSMKAMKDGQQRLDGFIKNNKNEALNRLPIEIRERARKFDSDIIRKLLHERHSKGEKASIEMFEKFYDYWSNGNSRKLNLKTKESYTHRQGEDISEGIDL